jgi:hypothetical protein
MNPILDVRNVSKHFHLHIQNQKHIAASPESRGPGRAR